MQFPSRRKPDAHIDLVPMIDTLLQLFIVFLLNMSFAASTVRLNLPKATADQSAATDAVVVVLDAANQLYLNDLPLTRGEAAHRIAEQFDRAAKKNVTFRADAALKYEQVVAALVLVQHAGADQINLSYEAHAIADGQ